MGYVHQHLLECAAAYRKRDLSPVVAWDCISAKTWAEKCQEMADEVENMPDALALAHLVAIRERLSTRDLGKTNIEFVFGLDFITQMERIIDPIARENRGWIEISARYYTLEGRQTYPRYRRMLGLNNCMDAICMEEKESEESWLKRRAEWLSRYHVNVWVVRDSPFLGRFTTEGFKATELVGTVGAFLGEQHVEEFAGAIGFGGRFDPYLEAA